MGGYFSVNAELEDGDDPVRSQSFPNEVVDKYSVERVIGRGAFGVVYEVVDRRSHAKLAMKQVEGHSGAYSKEVCMCVVWGGREGGRVYMCVRGCVHTCVYVLSCGFTV